MEKKLKIGIIGTGSISESHIHAYRKNPNVEVYAFCDIREDRLKEMGEKYGVTRLYTDKDVMLRELPELDAVSVCTWNSQHAPCTIAALKAGFMTTVPFLAAFVGVLLSGWVADLLVRKGFSLGFARKTPIICGLLISTCIMGANYTNDPMMIMCLMALAFFGNGFASITWSLVSSLAPMRLIGLTGGVFNFAGGLGGITVPLVVGYLAQGYGFAPALVYISAVALIGALSYILLVGDVKRVG